MESASSQSPSSSPDPHIDGAIKSLVCTAGCGDQVDALRAACFPYSDDNPAATTAKAEACIEATAALRSCMQATGNVYESYVGDTVKQEPEKAMEKASSASSPAPDPLIDGTIKVLYCLVGCEDMVDEALAACSPAHDDKTGTPQLVDVEACAEAGAALRSCMQMYEPYIRGTDEQQGSKN